MGTRFKVGDTVRRKCDGVTEVLGREDGFPHSLVGPDHIRVADDGCWDRYFELVGRPEEPPGPTFKPGDLVRVRTGEGWRTGEVLRANERAAVVKWPSGDTWHGRSGFARHANTHGEWNVGRRFYDLKDGESGVVTGMHNAGGYGVEWECNPATYERFDDFGRAIDWIDAAPAAESGDVVAFPPGEAADMLREAQPPPVPTFSGVRGDTTRMERWEMARVLGVDHERIRITAGANGRLVGTFENEHPSDPMPPSRQIVPLNAYPTLGTVAAMLDIEPDTPPETACAEPLFVPNCTHCNGSGGSALGEIKCARCRGGGEEPIQDLGAE